MTLVLALAGTLGLAAGPSTGLGFVAGWSEAASTFVTGAVLLLLAAAARRVPARKQ